MISNSKIKKTLSSILGKRTVYIGAKVTPTQKKKILELAQECNMTVSDYLLARAVNYKPKARLTPEEAVVAKEIVGVRSDLNKFFANLNGLSDKERIHMMKRYSFILKWLKELRKFAVRLEPIINLLTDKNNLPAISMEDNNQEEEL